MISKTLLIALGVTTMSNLETEINELQSTVQHLVEKDKSKDKIIDELQSKVADQSETIENQSETIEDLEARVDELESDRETDRKARAEDRKRLSDVESTIEEADFGSDTPGVSGDNAPIQTGDLTPIEQIARSGDVDDITSSASIQRAVSIFKNLKKWGRKTPKGIVLRPADKPLSLLEADRDEDLAWKQYYRAVKQIEKLSKGAATFFDSDRHGKTLVLHQQSDVYDRVTSGTLTPSSASATV